MTGVPIGETLNTSEVLVFLFATVGAFSVFTTTAVLIWAVAGVCYDKLKGRSDENP